jgi:hypothetical protein
MSTKYIVLGFILLLLFGCATESPFSPQSVDQAAVATSIKMSQKGYSAASLDSLLLLVKGDGIKTIKKMLIIDGTKAYTQVDVPTGKQLRMEVTGYQDSTAVLFGANDFTAKKGETAPVQIKLDFLVPTIILTPPDTSLKKGDRLSVYLAARNVVELATFGAQIQFDPTKLKVVELERQDEFLKSNAGSVMQLEFTKDNAAGTVDAVLGIFPASSGVSGSGNIGKIVFEALETDTTEIAIRVDNAVNSDLGLFDKNANLMYSVGLGSRLLIEPDSE